MRVQRGCDENFLKDWKDLNPVENIRAFTKSMQNLKSFHKVLQQKREVRSAEEPGDCDLPADHSRDLLEGLEPTPICQQGSMQNLKSFQKILQQKKDVRSAEKPGDCDLPVGQSCDLLEGLEPTPICQQGMLKAVDKVESLPSKMTQNCEEYIAALSHLKTVIVTDHCHEDDSSSPSVTPNTTRDQPDQLATTIEGDGLIANQVDPTMRIHPYQHERWMERYQALVEFQTIHGHCNVPYVYKENPSLGQWVKRQRHQCKLQRQEHHSNLTEDRIQMLEMLGFIWDSHGAAWDEKYQELKAFRKIHGHCNVPCVYKDSSKLSTWIKRQRRQYRLFLANNTATTIDHERIAKLEELGLVWAYHGGTAGLEDILRSVRHFNLSNI